MKYPKPMMRISELIYMGFSYQYLRRAYGTPGQTFATKVSPMKSNSVILFDTEEFEKWRVQDIENQMKGLQRK